jgi:DNA-binding response OmpR family regulator
MKPNAYLLLVDDDPVLLRSMARALGAAGYFVEVAFSAAEGMRLARFRRPDLILLDVVLSDGSGIEVCRSLKEGTETSGACVVLISGFQTSSGHQELGLAAGADAYIVRPISTPDLVARIGALLRVQQAQAALRETHASLGRAAAGSAAERSHDNTEQARPQPRIPESRRPRRSKPRQISRPSSPDASTNFSPSSHATPHRCSMTRAWPRNCVPSSPMSPPRPTVAPASRWACCTTVVSRSVIRACWISTKTSSVSNSRLKSSLGESVALEFQLAASLPLIFADPGMVEQSLLILADNALDAMPNGGRLVLQTQSLDIPNPDTTRIRGASAGPFVCLSVTDTGCGIAPDTRQRIFEPFFTTKDAGLWLWIEPRGGRGRGSTAPRLDRRPKRSGSRHHLPPPFPDHPRPARCVTQIRMKAATKNIL